LSLSSESTKVKIEAGCNSVATRAAGIPVEKLMVLDEVTGFAHEGKSKRAQKGSRLVEAKRGCVGVTGYLHDDFGPNLRRDYGRGTSTLEPE